jgi:hypothetical protein
MPKKNQWARPFGKRPQGKKLLIVSEGEITEIEYIQAIIREERIYKEAIEIDHKCTDPIGIVKRAKELRSKAAKGDRYDEVWCVFDVEAKRDQRSRFGLNDALGIVRANTKLQKICCAISNPCFEIWLLWHRQDQTAFIDSATAQRRCKETGITKGADGKHIVDAGALVKYDYKNAKSRAVAMEKTHTDNGAKTPEDKNPSSGVFELVDAIYAAFPPRE